MLQTGKRRAYCLMQLILADSNLIFRDTASFQIKGMMLFFMGYDSLFMKKM